MIEKADILFLTVNEHETNALLAAFEEATNEKASSFVTNDRVYHLLGSINGALCVQTITEMGSGGLGASQQAVNDSIEALDPTFFISVGVAFGVNEKKQKIGDILVSKQLWLYELQRKQNDGSTIHRGDKTHASIQLVNFFRSAQQVGWNGARVKLGVLLSGEKLIDNVDYRDQLLKVENEALGGETLCANNE